MAFDPITLLTIAVVVLVVLGALMLQSSRSEGPCRLLRWSGAAFLGLGAGFAMVLAAPTDIHAPLRILGNAAFMLAYGLLWAGTRHFDRRSAPFETVAAGALTWLLAAAFLDPPQAWRIGLTSGIVAAYSFAAAWECRRGAEGVYVRRWACWTFAAHGGFFALRAAFGPTFGLAAWGEDVAHLWGALLGLETILATVPLSVLLIGMSRERTASLHRREALEDVLTGIGNRRALFRSGAALLAAARREGRPAALLAMDLDGFKAVNDRHGHPAGDRLLVAFARLAHDYLPPTSLVCRIGGEEFAALLPGADPGRARVVADEIRSLFAHIVLDGPEGPVRTTVSIGIAQDGGDRAGGAVDPILDLLDRADLCLYAAKHGGRNRVVAEGDRGMAVPGRRPAA